MTLLHEGRSRPRVAACPECNTDLAVEWKNCPQCGCKVPEPLSEHDERIVATVSRAFRHKFATIEKLAQTHEQQQAGKLKELESRIVGRCNVLFDDSAKGIKAQAIEDHRALYTKIREEADRLEARINQLFLKVERRSRKRRRKS